MAAVLLLIHRESTRFRFPLAHAREQPPLFRVADDYQHLEDALPGFSRARDLVKIAGDSLSPLKMQCSKFDFYRFANRYRLALRFRGVTIEGFEPETVGGYGALVRLFIVWSVFERYCELTGEHPPFSRILSRAGREKLEELALTFIRHDPGHKLFDFLMEQSLEKNRKDLNRFASGNTRGVVAVAAALRHIFAHGHLTAHPNRTNAADLQAICDTFSEFFLNLMRTDFLRRVTFAEAMRNNIEK